MISAAARSPSVAPPLAPPCPACQGQPGGLEGHAALRVSALGAATMRFVCRDCGALWARADRGAGVFAWTAVDARVPADRTTSNGVPLPRR